MFLNIQAMPTRIPRIIIIIRLKEDRKENAIPGISVSNHGGGWSYGAGRARFYLHLG